MKEEERNNEKLSAGENNVASAESKWLM